MLIFNDLNLIARSQDIDISFQQTQKSDSLHKLNW